MSKFNELLATVKANTEVLAKAMGEDSVEDELKAEEEVLSKTLDTDEEVESDESSEAEESAPESEPETEDSEKAEHDALVETLTAITDHLDKNTAALVSILEVTKNLVDRCTSNESMSKSLEDQITKYGTKGAGRKSVTVAPIASDKPTNTPTDIINKALELSRSGAISATDVAIIGGRVTNGLGIPSALAHHFAN